MAVFLYNLLQKNRISLLLGLLFLTHKQIFRMVIVAVGEFFKAKNSWLDFKKLFYFELIILVFSIIILTALRFVYFYINSDGISGITLLDLLHAFAIGVVFDASILAYALILALIFSVCFMFKAPNLAKKIFFWLYFSLFIIVVALAIGDIFYSQSAGKRLTYEVGLIFSNQAFSLISTAFYLYLNYIIGFIVVGIIAFFAIRLGFKNLKLQLKFSLVSLVLIIVNLGVLVIVARGGVARIPLRISDSMITANQSLNEIIPNTTFMVIKSLSKSKKIVNLMPNEQAYAQIRSYIGKNDKYLDEKYPFLRQIDNSKTTIKPNVIFIVLESWSKKMIDSAEFVKYSPNFQKLKAQGMYFDNFYATGTRSANGFFATLTGYPDTVDKAMMSKPELNSNFLSLSDEFKQNGYNTSFFTGGELDYDNLKGLLIQENFDQYYGSETIHKDGYNFDWGTSDEVMFDFALDKIKQMPQPFYSMMFTTSTHSPYMAPASFDKGEVEALGVKETGIQQDYLTSLYYSDKQLGKFLDSLDKQHLLDNTLLVFVADHTHHMGLNSLEGFEIPMLWWSKNIKFDQNIISSIGSQYDILTTLTQFLGFKTPNASMGKNLLDLTNPANNFTYFRSDKMHLRSDNIYAVKSLEQDAKPLFFNVNDLTPINPNTTNQAELDLLEQRMNAYYQSSTSVLLNNKANKNIKN